MTKKSSPKKKASSAKASVKEKPVILITNDDGVTAPGIKNLVEAVRDLGKIVVVAPDKPQSGMATGNMYRLEIEKNRVILAEPISTGRIRSFEVLPSGRILASRPDGLILITREHEEPSK